MSYNINYEELRDFFNGIVKNIGEWVTNLDVIKGEMSEIVLSENFKGKTADAIKLYISDVHLYLIDVIFVISQELISRLILYQDGFYNYDDSFWANLNEDNMNDLRDRINSINTDLTVTHETCTSIMQGISDLMSDNLWSLDTYTFPLSDGRTRLVDYRDAIKEYDFSQITSTADLYEFMTNTLNVINNLRLTREVDVTAYQAGQHISAEERQALADGLLKSILFLTEYEDEIEDAREHQEDLYVEEYAGARTKSGVITTLMGVAILAITKKFKAASTAAKTLNYIVGTLGANMTIEGASDIYYGVTDDIYSESTNILLQYICQGNEDFYNGVVNFVSTLYSLIVPLDGIIASGGISMNAIITTINDVGIPSVVQGATLDISIQTAVNLLGQIMGVDPENSYLFGSVLGTTIGSSVAGGNNTSNVHVGDDIVEGGLNSINKLDDLLVDPSKLAGVSGDELYEYLIKNGYDVNPLSKGSYKGIPFEEGGGFKVNWGGDRILQYYPADASHHGGAYFKISSGETGTIRIDLDGNIIE